MTNIPSGSIEQRRLKFGEEITTWPRMKKAHALSCLMEIDRRLAVWEARELIVTVPRISEDGMTIEFDLRVHEQPPLDEWSLIFADAVHAFRSALDALAWEIATLDGNSPTKPNQVYFPIGGQGYDGKIAAMGVGIDPQFVERFRILQDPLFPLPGQDEVVDVLTVLHQLDIDDKHRGALRAMGQLASANFEVAVQLDKETEVQFQRISGDVPLEDGYTVARMLASKRARLESTAPAPTLVALSIHCSVGGKDLVMSMPDFVVAVEAAVEHAMRVMTEGQQGELAYEGGSPS